MTRILILYENTGAGHRRVGKLLHRMLEQDPNNEVRSTAASELFEDSGVRLVNAVWSWLLQANWIRTADLLINFGVRGMILPFMDAGMVRPFYARLRDEAPDMIISTADGYNKLLGTYAADCGIPFFLVNTEVSVFLDQVHPHAVHICYFPHTCQATRSFSTASPYFTVQLNESTSLGQKVAYVGQMLARHSLPHRWSSIFRTISEQNSDKPENDTDCRAVGPIVESIHYQRHDIAQMRQKHRINADAPCALVLSGSLGGRLVTQIVRQLRRDWDQPLTILAVCGRDTDSFRTVSALAGQAGPVSIIPFELTTCLDELYAAADVVIGRPSAGMFVETLVHHTPMLLSAKATTNDLGAVELVQKEQLGAVFHHVREIPLLLAQLLQEREHCVQRIMTFLQEYPATYEDLETVLLNILQPRKTTSPDVASIDATTSSS